MINGYVNAPSAMVKSYLHNGERINVTADEYNEVVEVLKLKKPIIIQEQGIVATSVFIASEEGGGGYGAMFIYNNGMETILENIYPYQSGSNYGLNCERLTNW